MPTWINDSELSSNRHVANLDQETVKAVLDTLELRIERFHGKAWTPREASEQLRGDGSYVLWLSQPAARSLTSISIDGDSEDTADFRLWESGRLERVTGSTSTIWGLNSTRFPYGAKIDVVYQHGADEPPADLLDAALRATATIVKNEKNSRVGERTETIETANGAVLNFSALPDWQRGRPLGMPDVDTVINSYGRDTRPVIA